MKINIEILPNNKSYLGRKRLNFAIGILFIMLLNFILSSCGTARRGEPVFGKMDIKNKQVKMGEIVFMNNCQKCHPGGESGKGPGINNLPTPGIALRFRVRSKAFLLGMGRMPSFKKHEISKQELTNLIVYLHTLKKNDEDAHKKSFAKK